jgi:glycosyltransferase 2 family protein
LAFAQFTFGAAGRLCYSGSNLATALPEKSIDLRKYGYLAIGVLISAFFLYLIIPTLHLEDVYHTLQTANYWWILPGVAVYFVGLWVRSWRWHYTLRHIKQIPIHRLFPLVCIGYFGNNVYPLRAGEVIRSYVLRQREQVAISSSLATVIIERVFDGLTMLLFVFLALPFAPMPPIYRNLVAVLTVLMLAATGVFVWIALRPTRVTAVYNWLAHRVLPARIRGRTDDIYQRFVVGLQSLGSRTDVLMIFGTSIIIWLIETLKYWFVMHAFPFVTSFLVLMLMNGLVNLATTLPSAPGYIGTFDAPGIETLAAFGVERNLAASYTFTLHVALWVPVTLVGAYYFWREQLRWGDFARANRQAEKATDKMIDGFDT